MVIAAEPVTWADAGLVLLLFLGCMALLFLYSSWSLNRRDEALGIPTRRRPYRLRRWR